MFFFNLESIIGSFIDLALLIQKFPRNKHQHFLFAFLCLSSAFEMQLLVIFFFPREQVKTDRQRYLAFFNFLHLILLKML